MRWVYRHEDFQVLFQRGLPLAGLRAEFKIQETNLLNEEQFTIEFAEMLGIDRFKLRPETDLTQLVEWDSVAYLSALVLIDERLGVTVPPDVLSTAKTFADILSSVDPAFSK